MTSIHARLLLSSSALSAIVILTGCPGEYGGGYEKVAVRERTQLAMAAAPDPPPVVEGVTGTTAAAPTLPANAPAGVTPEMVEAGQQAFGTICSACHGPGGAGTPAGPALDDQDWIQISGSFDELVSVIQNGVPNPTQFPAPMPPLGGGNFTPEQVRQLAAYVFAISHAAP